MELRRILGTVVLAVVAAAAFAQTRVVSKITFSGNKEISEVAIASAMTLKVGATYTEEARKADQDKILSLGFFRDAKIFQFPANDREIEIKVEVSEYPVIKEVRVTGNIAVKASDIEKVVLEYQQMGKIWSARNASPIKDGVKALYEKQGIFVDFEMVGPQLESPGTLTVAVLEPTIEQIKLVGLTRTKPETVKRMMKSKPGGTFNVEQLRSDVYGLFATQWFEDIKADPPPTFGERPGAYIVTLDFKEARTAQINAGVALDPQSRIVGTLSYGDTNFKGLGQNVGVQLSQATVGGGPSAEFGFGNRFYDSKDTSMSFRLFSKVIYNFAGNGVFSGGGDQTDQFDERRTGFQLNFSRPVGTKYRFNVGLQARNSRTIDLQSTGSQNYIQQDGDLASLTLGGEYDTTRGGADPYAGNNFRVTFEPGYSNITKVGGNVASFQDLVGAKSFLRTTLEYRQYWSKTPKPKKSGGDPNSAIDFAPRPVFAFRAKYGNISGTVPFFEQLFVGGSDSLRGYTNQRYWGSQSFLATLEYRYPLQRTFTLAAFSDYGGAWGGYGELNDFEQSSKPNLHFGYGLGLIFRVQGLGGIRVDLAFNQEGGTRTHFSFGQSF